jgi:hypothetical protein
MLQQWMGWPIQWTIWQTVLFLSERKIPIETNYESRRGSECNRRWPGVKPVFILKKRQK